MARSIARDHAEKRLAIQNKAAAFFARHGYDRSSMNQLAQACGVSKALIYHYYDSKDAILFDIVHTHLTELLAVMQSVDLSGPDKPANLRALVRAILAAYRDADDKHKVQSEAMTSLPEPQRAELAALQRQMIAIMCEALRAITPDLYERAPDKLRPVAMSLFGMLNWFYMWHRPGRGLTREAYADLVTDLVLKGVTGIDAESSSG